jgi:DNA-binding transcriptional ArsR family regulator
MAYREAIVALADSTRRQVFERLKKGPLSVNEIAQGLPVSRPAVSQHLKILKDAALVSETRVGTKRLYRIEARGLEAVRSYLDSFWDAALTNFKSLAESETPPGKGKRRDT